jgi:creatinine amidohydrolase
MMLLSEMNWMQVEAYCKSEDRLVVVTGSTEQHAHLSVATDTLVTYEVAKEACRRENVLLAPPLYYGLSQFALAYPGTLSVWPDTYVMILRDLIASASVTGFRRILFLNGHSGNDLMMGAIHGQVWNKPELKVQVRSWYDLPSVQKMIADVDSIGPQHAAWNENFRFNRVGEAPEGRKDPPNLRRSVYLMNAAEVRSVLVDGCTGGYYQQTDEFMERYFEEIVVAIQEELREL